MRLNDYHGKYVFKHGDVFDTQQLKNEYIYMHESMLDDWYTVDEVEPYVNAKDVLHMIYDDFNEKTLDNIYELCWDRTDDSDINTLQLVLADICNKCVPAILKKGELIEFD